MKTAEIPCTGTALQPQSGLVVVAVVILVALGLPLMGMPWQVSAVLVSLAAGLAWTSLVPRLYYGGSTLGVRKWSLRTTWIDLSQLVQIDYLASHGEGVPRIRLVERSGRSVDLALNFSHDDLWAPQILAFARGVSTSVDRRARESLEHADGTGNPWYAT